MHQYLLHHSVSTTLCLALQHVIAHQMFSSVLRFKKGDAFIGFQSQTPATVVLQASQPLSDALHDSWHDDVSVQCQLMLFVLNIALTAYSLFVYI